MFANVANELAFRVCVTDPELALFVVAPPMTPQRIVRDAIEATLGSCAGS